MCWNAPVSIGTFLTCIIMCAYLWRRNYHNDRPLSIWIAWFSLMQLFEFFMWSDMKNHTIAAKLSLVAVLSQPLVLSAVLYYYYYYKKNNIQNKNSVKEKILLWIVMFISFIKSMAAGLYAFTETKYKWLSEKGPNCHLVWWYIKHDRLLPFLARIDNINLFCLIIATLMINPVNQMIVYTLIGIITYVTTKIFYPLEVNSLFCWIANILAIVAIVLPYIKL